MKDTVLLGMMLLFMVDFLLLLGTNRLCGHPPDGLRAAGASVLGAIHFGVCMLPEFAFLGHWVWRIAFLGLMSLVAFGMRAGTLMRTAVFGLLQLAMAGITQGEGFWTVTLAVLVIFLLCMLGKTGPGKQYVPVTIFYRGRTVTLMALLDTGNTLKDPISGKSVLVADAMVGAQLLDLDMTALLDPIRTLESGNGKGLRLIPYNAIGQPRGLLLGLKPDRMTVDGKMADHILAFAPQIIGEGKPFQALVRGSI